MSKIVSVSSKKKICIIGANSYIARNLIITLNRSSEQYDILLYDYSFQHTDKYVNYSMINILSYESVLSIDFDCDLIFVFAGKTGTLDGFNDYEMFINVNEIGLLNIIKAHIAKKSKAKIIFPSTRLVYKGSDKLLDEDSPKEFKTVYAMNKYSCEQYLQQYSRMFGISYCIFRICVPYGNLLNDVQSYGTLKFMFDNAKSGNDIILYGDGSVRRTFTYIEDLCRIMILGSVSSNCVNNVFNIGGEELSLNEIAQMIAEKYKVNVKYKKWPNDAFYIESGHTVFNDEKIKSRIDFHYSESVKNWLKKID